MSQRGGAVIVFLFPKSWSQLVTWAHTTPRTGHPTSQCIYDLLHTKYWWPNMSSKIARQVTSCSIYAMSYTLPAGKLLPLPSLSHPWVTHFSGFYYWPALVTWLHHDSDNNWQLFKNSASPPSARVSHCLLLPNCCTSMFRGYGILEDIVSALSLDKLYGETQGLQESHLRLLPVG